MANVSPFEMRVLLLLILLAATVFVRAAEPFTSFNVVLLQPSKVLEERVPSVDAMAEYVKAIQAASQEAVIASGVKQSVSGFIVVAVRPGQRSKVWLDFDSLVDLELRKQLIAKAEAIKPFEVNTGPVVFALKVATWGAKESRRSVPLPREWKNASPGSAPTEVGELVERAWKE